MKNKAAEGSTFFFGKGVGGGRGHLQSVAWVRIGLGLAQGMLKRLVWCTLDCKEGVLS
jgi:hypothetical protein